MSTEPLRLRIAGASQSAVEAVAINMAHAIGRPVSGNEAANRLIAIALEVVSRCLACTSGIACHAHGTAGKQPPAPRANGTPVPVPGAHGEVLRAYTAEFFRVRGINPPIGDREGASVKRLLSIVHLPDVAIQCIKNAFADPFWARQATINSIAADPAKFLGNAGAASGKTSTLQRDSGGGPGFNQSKGIDV